MPNYPTETRVQLWPLCCGASILSGFKDAATLTDEQLDERIQNALTAVPHNQVFEHEQMRPQVTFLVLNQSQMGSKRIKDAITKYGFKPFAEFKRGLPITMWVRDQNNSFKTF